VAHDLPPNFAAWQRFNFGILRFCSELWVFKIPGWDSSAGVQAELELAQTLRMTIRYLQPNGLFTV